MLPILSLIPQNLVKRVRSPSLISRLIQGAQLANPLDPPFSRLVTAHRCSNILAYVHIYKDIAVLIDG